MLRPLPSLGRRVAIRTSTFVSTARVTGSNRLADASLQRTQRSSLRRALGEERSMQLV